jgi:hypothetical protein
MGIAKDYAMQKELLLKPIMNTSDWKRSHEEANER